KIVDSLTMVATVDPEYVQVTLSTQCKGEWRESARCDGLHQGDEVNFKATIQVRKCPVGDKIKFQLKPTSLEDHIDVELSVSCDCDCEKQDNPTYEAASSKCNSGGDLQCGVCVCNSSRYGDVCQCEVNSNRMNHNDTTATCRMNADSPICSDAGICLCGSCVCRERDNLAERYSGRFCECDNFTCLRNRGLLCSGPDHGTCVCGMCVCHPGWSGERCECAVNKLTCQQPGTNVECSGRGKCTCGVCKCETRDGVAYSGRYCQECPTCQSQQCAIYSDYVACHVFNSGPLKHNCPKVNFTIKTVDALQESDDDVHVCRVADDDGCYFFFRYEVDISLVEVQRKQECPEPVNVFAVVVGVVGGIVLMGIMLLISWKVITSIHDSREFAKFENESKNAQFDRGANPLYVPSTTTFANPTFRG
ncbi:hypothetical protein L9F63_024081, partial [Diploptera punctata]